MSRWIRAACEFARAAELLACVWTAGGAGASGRAASVWIVCEKPRSSVTTIKKLGGYGRVWSVRINEQYRAVGERDGDTISWAWIGTHNEFDNLFG
jgi:hypothetical protein